MEALLPALTVVAYLGACGLLLVRLARADATAPRGLSPSVGAVALLALVLHAVLLYRSVVTASGLDLELFNAASLIAWVMGVMVFLTALGRPVESLGVLVFPLAALAVLGAAWLHTERVLLAEVGIGVQIHVITSVLAASVLAIASAQALILLLHERRLRQRRPSGVSRVLPPLQTQEAMLLQMLAVGFFLLSLSLATGMMFVQDLLGQHLVHKTVLSAVAWLVFGTVLFGRWRHGWRGRTLVRWTLGGFCVLALAYFGSKLVLELLLGEAWQAA